MFGRKWPVKLGLWTHCFISEHANEIQPCSRFSYVCCLMWVRLPCIDCTCYKALTRHPQHKDTACLAVSQVLLNQQRHLQFMWGCTTFTSCHLHHNSSFTSSMKKHRIHSTLGLTDVSTCSSQLKLQLWTQTTTVTTHTQHNHNKTIVLKLN